MVRHAITSDIPGIRDLMQTVPDSGNPGGRIRLLPTRWGPQTGWPSFGKTAPKFSALFARMILVSEPTWASWLSISVSGHRNPFGQDGEEALRDRHQRVL